MGFFKSCLAILLLLLLITPALSAELQGEKCTTKTTKVNTCTGYSDCVTKTETYTTTCSKTYCSNTYYYLCNPKKTEYACTKNKCTTTTYACNCECSKTKKYWEVQCGTDKVCNTYKKCHGWLIWGFCIGWWESYTRCTFQDVCRNVQVEECTATTCQTCEKKECKQVESTCTKTKYDTCTKCTNYATEYYSCTKTKETHYATTTSCENLPIKLEVKKCKGVPCKETENPEYVQYTITQIFHNNEANTTIIINNEKFSYHSTTPKPITGTYVPKNNTIEITIIDEIDGDTLTKTYQLTTPQTLTTNNNYTQLITPEPGRINKKLVASVSGFTLYQQGKDFLANVNGKTMKITGIAATIIATTSALTLMGINFINGFRRGYKKEEGLASLLGDVVASFTPVYGDVRDLLQYFSKKTKSVGDHLIAALSSLGAILDGTTIISVAKDALTLATTSITTLGSAILNVITAVTKVVLKEFVENITQTFLLGLKLVNIITKIPVTFFDFINTAIKLVTYIATEVTAKIGHNFDILKIIELTREQIKYLTIIIPPSIENFNQSIEKFKHLFKELEDNIKEELKKRIKNTKTLEKLEEKLEDEFKKLKNDISKTNELIKVNYDSINELITTFNSKKYKYVSTKDYREFLSRKIKAFFENASKSEDLLEMAKREGFSTDFVFHLTNTEQIGRIIKNKEAALGRASYYENGNIYFNIDELPYQNELDVFKGLMVHEMIHGQVDELTNEEKMVEVMKNIIESKIFEEFAPKEVIESLLKILNSEEIDYSEIDEILNSRDGSTGGFLINEFFDLLVIKLLKNRATTKNSMDAKKMIEYYRKSWEWSSDYLIIELTKALEKSQTSPEETIELIKEYLNYRKGDIIVLAELKTMLDNNYLTYKEGEDILKMLDNFIENNKDKEEVIKFSEMLNELTNKYKEELNKVELR